MLAVILATLFIKKKMKIKGKLLPEFLAMSHFDSHVIYLQPNVRLNIASPTTYKRNVIFDSANSATLF